jgi:exoribonuclease R
MHYKIHIDDRNYENWYLYDVSTSEKIENVNINPIKEKLFHNDIFTFDGSNVKLLQSTIRKTNTISGVLVLKNNKTFGKFKNKYFYRCIPDDKRIPEFLIPYKPQIKFLKNQVNKYIVFRFINWNNKHPKGQIQQTIGDVTELSNYYEYQIYCKNLYLSIANFKKKTKEKLKKHNEEYYTKLIMDKFTIENRLDYENIITIDSNGSKDLDDAIGFKNINETEIMVSVYITNITFLVEVMDLWDCFSSQVATIYLPDRKRPMLPTILSDDISSLIENKNRIAFTLDINVNKKTGEIIKHSFKNTQIKVKHNLHHGTDKLKNNEVFQTLKKICQKMNKKKIYLDSVSSSSEIVSYYMVLMNYLSALQLGKFKTGIYRFAKENKDYEAPDNINKDVKKFLTIWNSTGGKYCKYEDVSAHEMLKLESYLHITSPNRRLVDMLNMIVFQDKLGIMKISDKAREFYDKWLESMDYINDTMRSIRKVQNDCSLLNLCSTNKELTKKSLKGFVFDKIQRSDNLFQYLVYIHEIKMINRVTTTEDLINLSKYKFQIYIFMDEIKLKQKIRILFQI